MTSLVVTTIIHLQVGLVIAAYFLDDPTTGAQVGLCVIVAAFGVIAVAITRVIHHRSILTPWLLLGPVPAVIGLWLILR